MRQLRDFLLTVILTLGAGAAYARDNAIIDNRAGVSDDLELIARHWPDARRINSAELSQSLRDGLEVIYYSGPVARNEDEVFLPDPSGAVAIERILGGRAGRTVLLINSCGTNMNVGASDFVVSGDWLAVFPASGANCSAMEFAQAALTALEGAPEGWADAFTRAGLGVARPRAANDPATAPALQRIQNDSIVISTVRPTDGPRIVAQEAAARPVDIPRANPAVAAPRIDDMPGDRSVRPAAPGLPQPSIIVGEQARPRPEFERSARGASLQDRNRIRQESPGIFAEMVAEGAFDPDEAEMAAAIQAELQRMSCYGGTVDGLWGAGSNAAVGRFVAKAGASAASQQPTAALYRQIISAPDTVCDQVVTTTPTATTRAAPGRANTASPGRTQPARGTTPSRRQSGGSRTQQPARGTSTTPQIAPSISGSGMFR